MISVVEVYNAIKDMANQDQKGFVTPQIFNSFAAAAQNTVFAKIADKMVGAKNLRLRGGDLAESDSILVKYKNFMSNYEKTVDLSQEGDGASDTTVFTPGDEVNTSAIRKPNDVYSIISIFDGDPDTGYKNFELVYNTRDMARILRSNLSAPTAEFPVALISNNIEIFPDDDAVSETIKMTYYRVPTSRTIIPVGTLPAGAIDSVASPVIATVANSDSIDIRNSRNFDLPLDMFPDLMEEIAGMIGINLRDAFLVKAAPKVVKK